MNQKKKLEDQLYYAGLIVFVLSILALWIYYRLLPLQLFADGCVWQRVLGIYCPGCGGTRAVNALLHGNILLSLWYHPLVPYTAILFGAFMVSQTAARSTKYRYFKGMRFHNWFLYLALVILIINFVGKNLLRFVWNITL